MAAPNFRSKILVLYKRSSFLMTKKDRPRSSFLVRARQNHIYHYRSLLHIEQALKAAHLPYRKHCRSRKINYAPYDLIITVGGDGTFLEAARNASRKQFILGVNSDPSWSVGQFCACDADGFPLLLQKFLSRKDRLTKLYKLSLQFTGSSHTLECLNDLLICHANPAAMSRYQITVKKTAEEHRSSGLWISTAAGSTGAIFSSGGKRMPVESRALQYRPRELYQTPHVRYRHKGGEIPRGQKITIISYMPQGCIFVDGAHIKLSFKYGQQITVTPSSNYVNCVHG